MNVDRTQALHFAMYLQDIARESGYNIGLTGGCLYKEGERKDMDFIVYPHEGEYSRADFLLNLDEAGYCITEENEWLVKLSGDFDLDLFFMYRAGGGSGPNVSTPTSDHIMPDQRPSVAGMDPLAPLPSSTIRGATLTAQRAIENNRQLRLELNERINTTNNSSVRSAINNIRTSTLRRIEGVHSVDRDVTRSRNMVSFTLDDGTLYHYDVNDSLLASMEGRVIVDDHGLDSEVTNSSPPPWSGITYSDSQ